MIRWGFQRGGAYFAINTVPGLPKRVMLCVGRNNQDHSVVFCRLGGGLYTPCVDVMEGREIARVQTDDGLYTVSAASEADVSVAANVIQAIG